MTPLIITALVVLLVAIRQDGIALTLIFVTWMVLFFSRGPYRGSPFMIPHSWLWLLAIGVMVFGINRAKAGL